MKKMLFQIAGVFFALCFSMSASAQAAHDVLSSLIFEAPKALYHAKGSSANMRQRPDLKARKVNAFERGDKTWIANNLIVNDEGDNQSWVTTHVNNKQVFISKSVMEEVAQQPFMVNKVQNIPYVWYSDGEYDDDDAYQSMEWRIGKVRGNNDLWVCQTREYNDRRTLRLGKMIGNVLVFKYSIYFEFVENLEGVNKWKVESEISQEYKYEGLKVYYLLTTRDFVFSKDFNLRLGGNTLYEDVDLGKLTEPMVYSLFKDVIQRGEKSYFYLTSYSFGKQWNI